jgi:PAS domain S-box-containing protein
MRLCLVKSSSCLVSTVFLFAVALAMAPWQAWTGRDGSAGGAAGGRATREAVVRAYDGDAAADAQARGGDLAGGVNALAKIALLRYSAPALARPAASSAPHDAPGGALSPPRAGLRENARTFIALGSAALVLALTGLNLWILLRRRAARAESSALAELNRKLFTEIERRKAAQEALGKSERRHRELLENINETVFSLDDGGTVTYVSPAVKTAGGYDPSEIAGQPFTRFIFGEDVPRALEYFEKSKHEASEPLECRARTKSGDLRWIRISCRPVHADGGHGGLQGTFADVTDRKWIEEILQDSEQKFRRVVEESPEGIVLVDSSGVIVEWNKGEEAIVGIERDEAVGRPVWDVMHCLLPPERRTPESHERIKEAVLMLILGRRERSEDGAAETEILRPDGGRRIVQETLFPIHTDKGCMVGSFTRDVTEEKKAQERIEVSLREKEVLLKEVHHRVKNNLQVISSLLDLSRLRTEDGPSRDTLTEARNKVYTMALIHSQLYASERVDRIDMAEYVRELATHIAKMYETGGASVTPLLAIEKIHLTMNQAIPCALVLNELITNAYKHAFRGAAEGTLIISMKKTGDTLTRIEVKDNGVGMPEKALEAGVETAGAGTLGLRLVQSIVRDQLKGALEIENDGGLAVRVTFADDERKPGS